ncbi:calcium/sodium antiporter [Spirochaeta lutea]|uniref:Sodium/calcium exchanger membrane region domain-containing protein n=1 Tax=Spirochaeta lutea TaxID=1480694 RepID=A0A098R1Y6_9SPIO|nr:calcium/sodium antiporter [Spirochaeta lutea]KGE73678.1 hypothetical protein DC28_00070 [Spirochaeta lutea]
MDILINTGAVLLGLVFLYGGGHFLVAGAGGIAKKLKISAIVIGLTVVAFGTSAPELFVSSLSALKGLASISLGNVIGSNIINIALVLGLSAIFMPIPVSKAIVRRDTPIMFLSYGLLILSILLWGFTEEQASIINRVEGFILLGVLVVYILTLYRKNKTADQNGADLEVIDLHELDNVSADEPWIPLLGKTLGGIAALAFGAEILVNGASWLAIHVFNVSERFVGITIVAFGTSLPELVTSIVAMARKEADISVGNIIGSNIFNTLAVIGVTAVIQPLPVMFSQFSLDFLIMVAISTLLYLVFIVLGKIQRWTGGVFLALYIGYVIFLLQNASV